MGFYFIWCFVCHLPLSWCCHSVHWLYLWNNAIPYYRHIAGEMIATDLLLIASSIGRNHPLCPAELPGNDNDCSAVAGIGKMECTYFEPSQMGMCPSHYLLITCRCGVDKQWDYDVNCGPSL